MKVKTRPTLQALIVTFPVPFVDKLIVAVFWVHKKELTAALH